jgi:hypothetical protein
MGYGQTPRNCFVPATQSSGALVLVLMGFGLAVLAFGLGIRAGFGAACVQATLAGVAGILLAGLWQGLAQVRGHTSPTSL